MPVLGRRAVTGRCDGGRLSATTGGLLLREGDQRNPASVEPSVEALAAQRMQTLALGCEDLHGHAALRCDAVLPLLAGSGLAPAGRPGPARARWAGAGRCGGGASRTLPSAARHALLVELDTEAQRREPGDIWLDLDATDAPLRGHYGC